MIKPSFNIKGETLAETIIALSILAIAITITSTVMLNSLRNLTGAKQRVMAVNIAREGIEAVRNIRDSNWLLYSDRRRHCWNHDPSAGLCNPVTPIEPGTYVVYKYDDPSGSWRLELADSDTGNDSDVPPDGIPDNDLDLAPLSLIDVDSTVDSDNADGDNNDATGNTDDRDMYNHMLATNPFGTEVNVTPFSRYVVIEYLENEPNTLTPPSSISLPEDSINTHNEWINTPALQSELNRMRVTSVVEWVRGGDSHSIELKTILTDHLGRTNLLD